MDQWQRQYSVEVPRFFTSLLPIMDTTSSYTSDHSSDDHKAAQQQMMQLNMIIESQKTMVKLTGLCFDKCVSVTRQLVSLLLFILCCSDSWQVSVHFGADLFVALRSEYDGDQRVHAEEAATTGQASIGSG